MIRTGARMVFLFLISVAAALILVTCSENETGSATTASTSQTVAPPPAQPTGELSFTAPPEWISEEPSSRMRRAQYRLPRVSSDPEDAQMVAFFFQGQGGAVQANIDRWIGQLRKADGGPASDVATVSRRESHGIALTLVDVSGTYQGSAGPMMAPAEPKPNFRMLAAIAETPSGPWFFKLTGPEKTVTRWEKSFHAFLDTLR